MVQILVRHGARYTLHPELLNTSERLLQDHKSGQLSPIGMRQLYILGQQLRKEYINDKNVANDIFQQQEIEILSSNSKRALQSAQSFMYGLYPVGSGYQIPENIDKKLLEPPYFFNEEDDILSQEFDQNFALPHVYFPYVIRT